MAAPILTFVTPWYAAGKAGAEVFCRGLAHAAASAGHTVEVFTTCSATPFDPWDRNTLPPGPAAEGPVTVRRFPVDPRSADRFAELWRAADAGTTLTPADEDDLIANSINSRALCQAIAASPPGQRLFFFLPYLYGTTWRGMAWARHDEAFLIPCLHNEPVAYLDVMAEMFAKAKACLFLSEPEAHLAGVLYGLEPDRTVMLGGGVDPDCAGDAAGFRRQHSIDGPFILAVGRKVPGKGVDILCGHFADYIKAHPADNLSLVLIGQGDAGVPSSLRNRIISMEAATMAEVFGAMAACEFLVHPSLYESFSIVMMEAWLNRRPVVVNARCEVTRYHAARSGGGLAFADSAEFCEIVARLRADSALSAALGAAGEAYVRQRYLWPQVIGRLNNFLARLGHRTDPVSEPAG